jgi:NDP-sugar pyrophosphorylase family protein
MSRADELPPVCILAGGYGSRLGALVEETPKPLLAVAGEPFVLHQLRLLGGHGARVAVMCVGHLGERIEKEVGRERFGIRIEYSYDAPGLDGTLGAVRRALPLLGDRFLVLYGDTYLRVDFRDVAREWRASGLPAVMTVFRNEGRWDTSNVAYDAGRVLAHDKASPTPGMRWIDYGLGGFEARALAFVPPEERDLSEVYRRLAEEGLLYGYEASERFFEIGTPESLAETDRFLRGAVPVTPQ